MDEKETIKACFKNINTKKQVMNFGLNIKFSSTKDDSIDVTDYKEAKYKFNIILIRRELRKIRRLQKRIQSQNRIEEASVRMEYSFLSSILIFIVLHCIFTLLYVKYIKRYLKTRKI